MDHQPDRCPYFTWHQTIQLSNIFVLLPFAGYIWMLERQQKLPTCRLLIPGNFVHHESPWHKNYVLSRRQPESITSFRTSTMWHVPDTHSHETSSPSRLHLGDGPSYAGIQLRAIRSLMVRSKGSHPHRARKLKVKQVVQHPRHPTTFRSRS